MIYDTGNFSEIQWWNSRCRVIEEIRALHRTSCTRFRVRVVVVLEMLTLMVLVLMMHGPITFALHLCLPPQLLAGFTLRVATLVVRGTMRWNIGRSTVSIAHRKDDGRDDNVFRSLGQPSSTFWRIGTSAMPCNLAERATFQHTAASLPKPVRWRDSWSFGLPTSRCAVTDDSSRFPGSTECAHGNVVPAMHAMYVSSRCLAFASGGA
jgi:hypothetical protein